MQSSKRLAMAGGIVAVLAAAALAGVFAGRATAAGGGPFGARVEPSAAKVATCDIYGVTDALIKSDRFRPDIEAEGDKMKKELEPLEKELQEMAEKLRGMNPQEKDAQDYYREFQKKQQEGQAKQQKLGNDVQRFIARKYIEAYKLVKASCEAVAKDGGYTHVVASRTKEEIQTDNPQQVVEALLARPVVVSPEGTDITDDVKKDLKLN